MGLKRYGVLRGRATGARREDDEDTPHYQVRVAAAGVDYRLAVNVKSQLSPSELLFLVVEDFRHPLTESLPALAEGFTSLAKAPETAALDFIRGNLFNRLDMRLLPSTPAGAGQRPERPAGALCRSRRRRNPARSSSRSASAGDRSAASRTRSSASIRATASTTST